MSDNAAFKELDAAFDSIIDEIENPDKPHDEVTVFRNLHGEKTEYADYAKVVHTVVVRVSEDKMSAAINVVSTAEKRRRYTIADLNKAIRAKKIVHGIDSAALVKMVAKQQFNRDIVFARGTPSENGEDGEIIHHIKFPEGKRSVPIKKGAEICRIIPPTAGTPGMDVYGHPLHCTPGHPITVPLGENTAYNRKENYLYAKESGSVSMENGVYVVCDELILNENITQEHGKIEFSGNIVINGSVGDNSIIISEKNIYIKGKVQGGSITAKGNITAEMPVKDSVLTTERGNMTLSSCTGCVINCGGEMEAASLYNCKTKCMGDLSCTINQGNINGGTTECMSKLTCNTAGSRLGERTEIIVGDSSDLVAERVFLIRSATRLDNDITKLDEKVSKLEIQKNALGFLSAEDQDFVTAANRIKEQKLEQKEPITARIQQIEKIMAFAEEAQFRTMRSLHAGVTLRIKGFRRDIDAEYGRITAYANALGIVIS